MSNIFIYKRSLPINCTSSPRFTLIFFHLRRSAARGKIYNWTGLFGTRRIDARRDR